MRIRPAAVAGRFYPDDPEVLAELVDRLLDDVRTEPPTARPVAVVAPHAGYRFSGAVAATAYAAVTPWREHITRVVLLGPAHFVPLVGMAVPGVDAFAGPLGPVDLDDDARRTVTGLSGVVTDDHAHCAEHSLETHLPFLQRALGSAVPVLPVLVGRTPPETVAALLSAVCSSPGNLAVVSTDLSHYLPDERARDQDARTAAAILARDAAGVGPGDACGHWSLRGLLRHAADRGLDVELLSLATSADAGADRRRVVGYGAFLLHGAAGVDRSATAQEEPSASQ